MWSLLSHLYQTACLWSKLILHWGNLDLFIKWRFSNQIFLIDLWNWLCSHQRFHLYFFTTFRSIHIKIFSFFLMIKISLFFFLKCNSLFINLSLCKYTWLDYYLTSWVEIYFNSVISLLLLLWNLWWIWFLNLIHSVV